MKRGGKMLICAMGLAIGASALTANSQDNPYASIAARNLFSLKPPPPPPPDPGDIKPPPPKITLQGITSILGRRQVMFKTPPQPKPGEPPKDMSFILNEGERESDIEVQEINETAGSVKFDNHGTIQLLTMDKDGANPPAGAPGVPAAPGMPPVPGAYTPPPAGMRTIPPRTLRLPPAMPPSPAASVPTLPVPTSPIPAPASTPPAQQEAKAPSLTPEEQAIIMRALREEHANDPDFPPLPPQ